MRAKTPAELVIGRRVSEPTRMKRELSLALVCMFCSLQKSLKKQQGAHLCKQVQEMLLTRLRGGGNPFNIYRLSHIKFHSVNGRRRITIQPPPPGLVKFNM